MPARRLLSSHLKSHIELDGDSHGPAAEAILENAIQGDPDLHRLAMDAAGQSIQALCSFGTASCNRCRIVFPPGLTGAFLEGLAITAEVVS